MGTIGIYMKAQDFCAKWVIRVVEVKEVWTMFLWNCISWGALGNKHECNLNLQTFFITHA
jgi:hypothetical protein